MFSGPASAQMTVLDGTDVTAYVETQSGITFFDSNGTANFEVGKDGMATVNVWGEGTVTFKFAYSNNSGVHEVCSQFLMLLVLMYFLAF